MERIKELLQHSELIRFSDIELLKAEITKYPYYQPLRMLYLKAVHQFNSHEFQTELEKNAVYFPYKSVLFEAFHSDNNAQNSPILENKLTKVETHQSFDNNLNLKQTDIFVNEDKSAIQLEENLKTKQDREINQENSTRNYQKVEKSELDFSYENDPIYLNYKKLGLAHLYAPEASKKETIIDTKNELTIQAQEEEIDFENEKEEIIDEIQVSENELTIQVQEEGNAFKNEKEETIEEIQVSENELTIQAQEEEIDFENEKEETIEEIQVSENELTIQAQEEEIDFENEKEETIEKIQVSENQLTTEIQEVAEINPNEKTIFHEEKVELKSVSENTTMSFKEWLQLNKIKPYEKEENKNVKIAQKIEIIENFIEKNPKIQAVKTTFDEPIIETKLVVNKEEISHLMTETLANLYVEQNKMALAIRAFKILSLKYPEKSRYFADRIEEIKKLKLN